MSRHSSNLERDSFLAARDLLLERREDYRGARLGFQWPQLETFNWATDYFDDMASGNSRTALWIMEECGEQRRVTFAEMSERSSRVANYLRRQGIGPGDRILLMIPNQVTIWEVMLAALKVGAVLIPATTLLNESELCDRILRGSVSCVITSPEFAGRFAGIQGSHKKILVDGAEKGWSRYEDNADESAIFNAPTIRVTDPYLLYFTSGTTALPKMVLHSRESYPVGHLSSMYWAGIRTEDVHFNISSPGWAKHAYSCVFAPWNAGATVFVQNYKRFDSISTLQAIEHHGVTSLCAPPTVWRLLVLQQLDSYKTRLRNLISAGEPLNPEVIEKVFDAWGLTIRDGYGQTETVLTVGNSPGELIKPGSMGKAMPGFDVVLLDPADQEATEGEICLRLSPRPTGLMIGYQGDASRTEKVTHGGYYRTGDIASRDLEGYFTYVGRADDVFKSSDYRISPFELESALIEHECVAEAAVIPVADALRAAVPKAFVVLRPGVEPNAEVAKDIFFFLRSRLSPFKRIRRIEFGELPKTISGKIRRAELRRLEGERTAAGSATSFEYSEEQFF